MIDALSSWPGGVTPHRPLASVSGPGWKRSQAVSCLLRLESNCNYDYIDVFDGPCHSSPLIARLCHGASNSFTSSSNFMSIRFVSDGSVTRRGFRANYYSSPSNDSTRESPARGAPLRSFCSRPAVAGQDARVALAGH